MDVDASLLGPPVAPLREATVQIARVGMERFPEIQDMNEALFGDRRVIFRTDREDLTLLIATDTVSGEAVGYKVGYGESGTAFYSAKGGVLPAFRRRGLARRLLHRLMDEAREMGYRRFAYDTFPNKHPGMTVLGLAEGFRVTAAGYNAAYRDYRIRFETKL